MSSRRLRCFALAGLAVATCSVGVVPAAAAAWPAEPSGVRLAAASPHSFTISSRRSAHATRYVLVASPVKSDVYYANLSKHRRHRVSAASRNPHLTIRGLHYSAKDYYYRVEARNGAGMRVSDIRTAHLAPPAPARVAVTGGSRGLALTWTGASVGGYDIVQGTDAKLRSHRTVYSVNGLATQFTPYRLSKGTTYYFRVRARNGSSRSSYSPVVSKHFTGGEQSLRVLTYNVLHPMFDGTKEGGNRIAPWSQRMPAAAALIKGAAPDVVSIQEASDWIDRTRYVRAIDTLAARLRSTYALAHTETLPNPRTGNYILYRRSAYETVGSGGYWTISNSNWVAYQQLRNKASGATFLFVAVHLTHGPDRLDSKRARETRTLLADAKRRAGGIPVIFAGDFNSFTGPGGHPDSPERLMRSARYSDALVAAQSRRNTRYGSVNDYTRVPSHSGRVIDHVFASPGVGVRSWAQVLRLRHGRFVGVIPSDHNPVVAGLTVGY